MIRTKEQESAPMLGFWLYLMTDLMLFSTVFAAFMVLRHATAGGPSAPELFSMKTVLTETMILLASSLFCGLAWLALRHKKRTDFLMYSIATLLAGAVFLAIEIQEFAQLVHEGFGPSTSAFLSSFFTLVGMHGFHIAIGLLWGIALLIMFAKKGFGSSLARKFALFAVFWHFLDIVWIFIFTIVYVIGVHA